MAKTRCEICNRTFKNEEALEMHNAAKHFSPSSQTVVKNKKISGKVIGVVIIILVLGGIVWAISGVFKQSNECKTAPITELSISGHTNLPMHIHQQLQIVIDGIPQLIPTNIGISPGIMRPIHTHDASGELHVEPPCVRDVTLGDFFQVWGQTFNSECIFDKCINNGTLTITVNGNPNNEFKNLILRDHQNIVIRYDSNSI